MDVKRVGKLKMTTSRYYSGKNTVSKVTTSGYYSCKNTVSKGLLNRVDKITTWRERVTIIGQFGC
jgi:hypothetical protein